ncbi:unnamed protein product, partial [Scytosiphon promiscuus]
MGSRWSREDIVIDASEEDLPPGWIKKRRVDGSTYYASTTGAEQAVAPHQLDEPSAGALSSRSIEAGGSSLADGPRAPSPPPPYDDMLQPSPRPTAPRTDSRRTSRRTTGTASEGNTSFRSSTTGVQDEMPPPPTYVSASNFARGQGPWRPDSVVSEPRSGLLTRWWRNRNSTKEVLKARNFSKSLTGDGPPKIVTRNPARYQFASGWSARTTSSGAVYYMNHVTKETQWERPTAPAVDVPLRR